MATLSASDVERDRALVLLDIRPFAERAGEIGFLPGSISWDPHGAQATVDALSAVDATNASGVVLYCMSGRRTAAHVDRLGALGVPVHQLDGGVLGWREAGFPVGVGLAEEARLLEEDLDVRTIPSFRRALTACFVAEAVECMGDRAAQLPTTNPRELLSLCFELGGVSMAEERPELLYRVVDFAASLFRRLDVDTRRMAENMSRMYGMLGRIQARDAGAR